MDNEALFLAESEESSIVYGMPAAAVATNHINQVVHLNEIGNTLNRLVNKLGSA